jgi:glutathione synthase/RimK-type ligase-like ATP-grasp enzyme
MPTGNFSHPDWRDVKNADELIVSEISDMALEQTCARILDCLGIEYCSFDFISAGGETKLIDINPHGTWHWLPNEAASKANAFVSRWISHILSPSP